CTPGWPCRSRRSGRPRGPPESARPPEPTPLRALRGARRARVARCPIERYRLISCRASTMNDPPGLTGPQPGRKKPCSPAPSERGEPMRSRIAFAVLLLALLAPSVVAPPVRAQNALVVSVWGGNWKDTVDKVVGRAFTAKTGIPVEYEVGGTIDRLAKARVAKGNPLVDLNFTTTHVARLYISDGLYDKLDLAKLPSSKEIA